MFSDQPVITFNRVWKKYLKNHTVHHSLREDIMSIFSGILRKNTLRVNEFWALQNINFTINQGEIVALVGPNGAGKSSIFKIIANVTYPTKGEVVINGKVAPIIELGAGFHPDLSGYENIFIYGAILGMKIKEIKQKVRHIIEFAEIREFIHTPVKYYSSGMYVRLAFAIAIHSEADIYLFDEVIAVGDLDFQDKCFNKIMELRQNNKTIVFVRHDLELIMKFSARVIHINKGKLDIDIDNKIQ